MIPSSLHCDNIKIIAPWPIARACQGYLKCIFLDHIFETTAIDLFRVRQKVSALCNQAKVDLEEEEGCGTCDKGTETGVYGIEGLCRAQGVRHQRLQQGLQRGGCVGCQPERSSSNLPTNKWPWRAGVAIRTWGFLLNKANQHITCSFVRVRSRVLCSYGLRLK